MESCEVTSKPMVSHPTPTRPWQFLSQDILELESKHYLVTVGSYNDFYELDQLDHTLSTTIVNLTKAHLARHTHRQSHPSPKPCEATSSITSSEYPSEAKTLPPHHTTHSVGSTSDSTPLHCSPNGTAISIRARLMLKITPLSLCPSLNQHPKSTKPTPVRLKLAQ